jgi:hypothetical protein
MIKKLFYTQLPSNNYSMRSRKVRRVFFIAFSNAEMSPLFASRSEVYHETRSRNAITTYVTVRLTRILCSTFPHNNNIPKIEELHTHLISATLLQLSCSITMYIICLPYRCTSSRDQISGISPCRSNSKTFLGVTRVRHSSLNACWVLGMPTLCSV